MFTYIYIYMYVYRPPGPCVSNPSFSLTLGHFTTLMSFRRPQSLGNLNLVDCFPTGYHEIVIRFENLPERSKNYPSGAVPV